MAIEQAVQADWNVQAHAGDIAIDNSLHRVHDLLFLLIAGQPALTATLT